MWIFVLGLECRCRARATSRDSAIFLSVAVGAESIPRSENVAEQLTEDEEIAFSAGLHTELVGMSYKDFDRLVMPTITALT